MILDRFTVTDQVAVVTGAGRGIGAATAVALAESGAGDHRDLVGDREPVEDHARLPRTVGEGSRTVTGSSLFVRAS